MILINHKLNFMTGQQVLLILHYKTIIFEVIKYNSKTTKKKCNNLVVKFKYNANYYKLSSEYEVKIQNIIKQYNSAV